MEVLREGEVEAVARAGWGSHRGSAPSRRRKVGVAVRAAGEGRQDGGWILGRERRGRGSC